MTGDLSQIEAAARGGGLTLLALWACLLLRDARAAPAARALLFLILTVAGHLIAVMPGEPTGLLSLDVAVEILSGLVAGAFWLFTCVWFDDRQRIGRRAVLLVAASGLPAAAHRFAEATGNAALNEASGLSFRITVAGFALAGLWVAWRGRAGDLVEQRRRVRTAMIVAVGLYVLLVNAVEIAMYGYGAPRELQAMLVIGIALLVFALCAALLGTRDPDLLAPPQAARPQPAPRDIADDAMVPALGRLMQHDRLYRDETLSVGGLAARLGIPEHRLRRVINGTLGHRNFAAYLNGFRLAEVKAALADATQRDVPILTIALDAGFGSLAPFNRAFRDAEGMTPTEYRQRHG
jgi:AraC-like DNA-binding protein